MTLLAVACGDPETQKRSHLARGDEYVAEKKDQFAVIEYTNAVRLDPQFGEARYKLAQTLERMNDLRSAYPEYVRAADALPDDRAVQVKATEVLLVMGRFDDAKARAGKLLEKDAKDLDAMLLHASAMALLRDPAGAIAEAEEALSLRPGDTRTLMTLGGIQMHAGDARQAEEAFRQAVAMNQTSVDAHLAFANFLLAAQRTSEAEQHLSQALALEPQHLLANRMLGVLYMATDRARQAEGPLKVVAEADKTAASRFQLADYYLSVDRRNEARQLLTELATEPSAAARAETQLAAIAYGEGDTNGAHKRMDEVLARLPNYVPGLVIKAQWLTTENKLDEALARGTAAVTADPSSAAAHFTLGSIHQRRRDTTAATKSYTEVVRLNPRALAAQVELSRLNLATGNRDAAVRHAQEAKQIEPTNAAARVSLARALLSRGDLVRAQIEISELLRGLPDNATVHTLNGSLEARRNNLETARKSFARALELSPADVDAIAGLVGVDVAAKQLPAAIARVESEVAKQPDRPELLVLAARVYSFAAQYDKAEQALRRAVSADPGFSEGYVMLAQLYIKQNRTEDARKQYEQAVEREPKAIGPRTMVGVLYEAQNRRADAKKVYEDTVAVGEAAPVAANNLAYLYAEEGVNLDMALQLATSAKQRLPDNPDVDDTIGWIYYKKDLPALAVAPFQESLKKRPNQAEVLYHLGLTYTKTGDNAAARDALQRALKIKPDFPGNDVARRTLASLPQ